MKNLTRFLTLATAVLAVGAHPALACDPAAEAKGAKACCTKGVAEGKACCAARMKGAAATVAAAHKGHEATTHHGAKAHGQAPHADAAAFAHVARVVPGDLAAWRVQHPEAVVVDVREPAEFAEGHVEGAILAPLGTLATWAAQQPKERPVVLVCKSGRRATKAAEQLGAAGFKALVHLEGGMEGWKAAGLPVALPAQSPAQAPAPIN
ncbi:MAG: rhodanese-like domain-containing protein [Candidatus Sericytochromatia bacterium]|nr:rhodanese-like domain-containing protein [Candidatus Sericytochromatia bacterium]